MGAFAVYQSRDDVAKCGEREVDLCCLLANENNRDDSQLQLRLDMCQVREEFTFNLCPLAPVLLCRSLHKKRDDKRINTIVLWICVVQVMMMAIQSLGENSNRIEDNNSDQ